MPVNNTIRTLARDGRISQQDAQQIRQGVQSGTISQAEAQDATGRYAEAMDQDAATTMADAFSGGNQRGRLSSLPEGMLNTTLQKGMRSDGVNMLQRALMSVGLSSQNPGMALPSGADGIFGTETQNSVKAFQKANGLPETGKADPKTLRALNQALAGAQNPSRTTTTTPPTPTTTTTTPTTTTPTAPTVGATLPAGVQPGTPQALISASNTLATGDRAANYGTINPWKNIDPNHAAPVDVRMGGLANRWKCNLFGGNALAAGGFEPPYYGNRKTGGEYPVAEQWHRWATPSAEFRARATAAGETVVDHAKTSRNPSRFDLMDEVRPTEIQDPATRRKRIEELLSRVQPGDVVTVDHPGASGSDGGHVRVCVGRDDNGRPLFAQAKQDSAKVVAEGFDEANWDTRDAIYILRPNTPRQQPAR